MDRPARLPVDCPRYAYGQAANRQELEDAARQAIGTDRYAPYGSELYPFPAGLAAQLVR